MKKLILLGLFFLSLTSCRTINIHSFKLETIDEKFIDYARKYRLDYKDSVLLFILENSINDKNVKVYIKRISNSSFLYRNYISFFYLVDNIPIVISSSKDGYITPDEYDSEFIKLISNTLNDDMLKEVIKYKSNPYSLDYIESHIGTIIDHSLLYEFRGDSILKHDDYSFLYTKGLLKENSKTDIVKHFRVISGGVDNRKR